MIGSDFALLEAWQGGDARAGDTLVRRHFSGIHRFFANKLGPAGEELTQQTFLACAAQRERLPTTGSFRAYLFGIARRQLFLHFRREHHDIGAEQTLEGLGTTVSGELALRDDQRLLLLALRQLPIDGQIALELFYWEQMSIPEIAVALDAPVGTVKARLSRARAHLREYLLSQPLDPRSLQSVRVELDRWAREIGDEFRQRVPHDERE